MKKPQIVSVPIEELANYLQKDALKTLNKSLALIASPTETELKTYDEWIAQAASLDTNVVYHIFTVTKSLNTQLVNQVLMDLMPHFHKASDNASFVKLLKDMLFLIDELWINRSGKDAYLLSEGINCFNALLDLNTNNTLKKKCSKIVGTTLANIARYLDKDYESEQAVGTLLTAIVFCKDYDKKLTLKLCEDAIGLAYRYIEEDVSVLLAQTVNVLCEYAEDDEEQKLVAYDSLEGLLRYIILKYQKDKDYNAGELFLDNILYLLKTYGYLSSLSYLYFGIPGIEGPKHLPDLQVFVFPIWEGTSASWFKNICEISIPYITEMADARFNLLPTRKELMVNFNSWAINYSKMLNSIPHGQSILKEEDLDSMLLNLKHELVHVYSLFGTVGLTLDLMRWTLVDLESLLHAYGHSGHNDSLFKAFIAKARPAELMGADLNILALTERSAVIESKIKTYEQIWTPWFEGLALYGEFTDDPTVDSEIESPMTSVMSNLVDFIPDPAIKDQATFMNAAKAQREKLERCYSKALNETGRYVLRPYLTSYHKQYLPGYFTVRAVVKKWRSKLGKRLMKSDQAFRILLHLTRYSGEELIPDLSIPAEEFKEVAIQSHLKWLEMISDVDAADLIFLIEAGDSSNQQGFTWMDGKLIHDPNELAKMGSRQANFIKKKSRELLSTYIGKNHNSDRFKHQRTQKLAKEIAKFAEKTSAKSFVLTASNEDLVNRNIIMPLAFTQTPFWLMAESNRLCCLIRTREKDSTTGNPSYNLTSLALNNEDFTYLTEHVKKHGSSYIEVTRAVFLGGAKKSLVSSNHYLVYKLGDWIKIQSAGLIYSNPIEPDVEAIIRSRFTPHNGLYFKDLINSSGLPCTIRTQEWLTRSVWTAVDVGGQEMDLTEWAEKVNELCTANLENHTEIIDRLSLEMLNFVYSDMQLAKKVFDSGLDVAASYENSVTQIVTYLFESAKASEDVSVELFENQTFFKPI